MLVYKSMTEEQIDAMGLLPKGDYKFRVIEAEDTFSKSGNPQIKLKLRLIDNDGAPRTLTVYLGTNGQFMLRQLRHFARATGLMHEYESEIFCADTCLNSEGLVTLDIEEGGLMTDGSNRKFNDKNIVVDYIGDQKSIVKPSSKKEELNDDIPF